MAQETFAFSSSALRSLRLQQELLEQEDRRRALARESATRRFLSASSRPPLNLPRRPQYCQDPAVHNALYTGDLPRIKSIFKDETTTNMVMETVSEELVWSPEQGTGLRGCTGWGGSLPFGGGLVVVRGARVRMQLLGGWGEEGWLLSFGGDGTSLGKAGAGGDPAFLTTPQGFSWLGVEVGGMSGLTTPPPGLGYEWVGGVWCRVRGGWPVTPAPPA